MKKKIIIIGAGIAGLSAGCYAQMNGYDAEIFEMHNLPGGLCTSWKRKGYTFDGCIHFLIGTNPDSPLHNIWNEVGAFENNEIINHDVYMQIEGDSGKKLTLYCDIDRLDKHLLELSPADAPLMKELTDAVRNFSIMDNTPVRVDSRLMHISMREFIKDIKDPFLKEALSVFKDMQFFLMTMSAYSKKDAGWPAGGSLEFARGIERKFLDLGGKISYKAGVDEILVESGRAVGVRLVDGTVHTSDIVISAADGHATLFRMLRGKYISSELKQLYARASTYPTSIQVSAGINTDLSGQPHKIYAKIARPVEIAGVMKERILFQHYCYDQNLCPRGKSVITSLITSSYDYWEKLYANRKAYQAEKDRIASWFIEVMEERFPEVKGKVEVVDVATPVTYNRYTGAWKGSYMGWMPTPENPVFNIPASLPDLDGFHITGQWTYSRGGLPTALFTARGTIMKICHAEGKDFVTTSG